MKRLGKWSPICLVLIAGLIASWMVVQQAGVTPSEAQIGPGSQPTGPPVQGPPPKLPPKLKAPTTPPPDEQEMGPPPAQTPRQRPTKESLLEKIRQMPGGKEMLEEARKRGAQIGMGPVESESSLSWLNPFRVEKAEATGTFSLTLDWSNTWYSSSPYGYVGFYGAYVDQYCRQF